MDESQSKLCYLCLSPANIICKFCNSNEDSGDSESYFCSQEHLDLHRDAENDICFPFRVAYNERVGHYMVSTRDLSPLDIIMREKTGVPTGPLAETRDPTCLSCYSVLVSDKNQTLSTNCFESEQRHALFSLCPNCDLPMCKENDHNEGHNGAINEPCHKNQIHRDFECKLFQRRKIRVDIPPDAKNHPFYSALITLRMLIIKLDSPTNWERIVRLMDHKEDRMKDKLTWTQTQDIIQFIQNDLGLEDLFNEDEIQHCIGVVHVNAIKSKLVLPRNKNRNEGCKFEAGYFRCVYPTMAIFSNCCECNARCIHHGNFGIEIRAQKEIKRGEELTIQYQSLFTGSRKRRAMFKKVWYFDCECPRCQDPSELGSYLNAFICPNDSGVVLSENPLNYEASWRCENFPDTCNFEKVSGETIERLETDNDEEIMEGPQVNVEDGKLVKETFSEFCERMLEKLTTKQHNLSTNKQNTDNLGKTQSLLFHQNHYLVMKLKSHLISQYGGTVKRYSNLDESTIIRKIELCEEFIDVFSKIDSGESTDWWAVTMYEKIRAQMILDQRKLESERMSMKEFIDNVPKSIEMWKKIMTILWMEPEGSYLRKIASQTEQEISKAQDLVLMAQFL